MLYNLSLPLDGKVQTYLALGVLVFGIIVLIKRLSSPVARLPGPFLTKFTALPIIYQDSRGRRTIWTQLLHEKYGSIVRLSPTEVSITSATSIRDVYSGSAKTGISFGKPPSSGIFRHFGARNAFSSIENDAHAWRRKIAAGNYALSAVTAREVREGGIWNRVGKFMAMVEREGLSSSSASYDNDASDTLPLAKSFDLFTGVQYYSFDNVSAHMFGDGNGTHAMDGDDKSRRIIANSRENPSDVITYFRLQYSGLHAFIQVVKKLLWRYLGVGVKPASVSRPREVKTGGNNAVRDNKWVGGTEIRDWGWKKYQGVKQSVISGRTSTGHDDAVAARLALNVLNGEKAGDAAEPIGDDPGVRFCSAKGAEEKQMICYRDEGAASECMDHLLAGMDTVADTLSYILHALSLPANSKFQDALRQEIRAILPGKSLDFNQPLDQKTLSNILNAPCVNAIVHETLRLYPASATSLHRETPVGDRVLDGYLVPAKTIVAGTPFAVNQDRDLFDAQNAHSVSEWVPERWLEADGEKLAEMSRRLWTFGSGARGCIGRHLATTEMKLLLAGIYASGQTFVDNGSHVEIQHQHWKHRVTSRDIVFFGGASGVIGLRPL